jgi:hypothetical protein
MREHSQCVIRPNCACHDSHQIENEQTSLFCACRASQITLQQLNASNSWEVQNLRSRVSSVYAEYSRKLLLQAVESTSHPVNSVDGSTFESQVACSLIMPRFYTRNTSFLLLVLHLRYWQGFQTDNRLLLSLVGFMYRIRASKLLWISIPEWSGGRWLNLSFNEIWTSY